VHFISLHLMAYGHFTDKMIDLGPRTSGLWFVHGLNEAGKSTALAAITDFLFGFEKTTPYDFKHDNPFLRVGATLGNDRGERLTAIRRKGIKDTLLDAQQAPLDPGVLLPFLEGLDRKRFELFYGLNHERLQRGGEAVLHDDGDVGTLLFAAGSGMTGVRGVMERIRQEAEAIYKPRGKTQKINQLHHRLQEVYREQRQRSLSREQWLGHRQARERLQEQIAAKGEQLKVLRQREGQLRRIVTIGPMLVRLAHHRTRQEELAAVPSLGTALMKERAALMTQWGLTGRDLELHRTQLNALEAQIGQMTVEETLPAAASQINALYREVQGMRETERQLPALEAKLTGLNRRQTELWDQVGGRAVPVEERGLPDPTRLAHLDKLKELRPTLLGKLEERRQRIHALQTEAHERQGEIQSLGAEVDIGPFRERLPWLRQWVQRDGEAGIAFSHARNAQKQAEERLSRLPLWRGTVAELAACRPPTDDMIERFIRTHRQQGEERHRIEKDLEQLRVELQQRRERLVQWRRELGEDPPTDAAVREARMRRDELWRRIRHHGLPGGDLTAGDAHAALGEALSLLMARADHLADGRLREAGRLARLQQLEAELQEGGDKEQRLVAQLASVTAGMEQQMASWNVLWRAVGMMHPGTPSEMKGWPTMRSEILSLAAEAEARHETGMAIRRELSAVVMEAQALVSSLGGPGGVAGEPLAVTVSRWEDFFNQCATRIERRVMAERRLSEIERELQDNAREVEEYRRQLIEHEERWNTLLRPFRHEAGMEVEASSEFLGLFRELREGFGQREELLQRIREIERQRNTFMAGVRELERILKVREPLAEHVGDALNWLEAIKGRLDQALEVTRQRRDLLKRRDELMQKEQECLVARNTISQRLEEIRQRYGTSDLDAMEVVEEQAKLKEETARKIIECEGEILGSAEGRSLAAVMVEIGGEDVASAGESLEALRVELDGLTGELRSLDQALGGVLKELESLAGGDTAARLRQEMDEVGNDLLRHALHYVHLGVAETLLQQVILRFQEQNQDPVLRGAAGFFRELTSGSFVDLRMDEEDSRPFFYGVRVGGEKVRVEGMSAGTRDQLFLALRLGAMSVLNAGRQPIPLILDDLLIHFDDRRAVAALKLLAGLGRQVIYFTHHPHLLELASGNMDANSFAVCEL